MPRASISLLATFLRILMFRCMDTTFHLSNALQLFTTLAKNDSRTLRLLDVAYNICKRGLPIKIH